MHGLPTDSSPIRALLVEDNPGDVMFLRQMLQEFAAQRIDVVSTERLESACQHLAESTYDVILLDLSLPDSHGYQTFERLRAVAHQVPIILLTGLDDEALALRAVRAGAQDYLVKGEISNHLLIRAIRYAIERKKTESMLRESQLRYKALFENANTGIFLISLAGTYLNLNQKAIDMLGRQDEEMVGKAASDFYVNGQREDFQQHCVKLIAGTTIPIYECLIYRRDQQQLPIEVNLTLVRDATHQPLYMQIIARDISKRRRAQEELRAEREQLAQRVTERTTALRIANSELTRSARMKDEFLATVSHELRTPLSVILTLSEAVQDRIYGEVNEPQQKALQRIRKSGRHLLALINDILDVSKIESGKFELEIGPVSVQTLCEDCLQMLQEPAQSKNLTLRATLDPTVTILYGDGRRLMQILLNLLNNAIKFTSAGGTIDLSVVGDLAQEQITLTVQDTGIGIKEADMLKLFQPFVQLDSRLSRNYQGAGLGLALVYRLVKLHGGSVVVESKLNEGSRFSVVLPWRAEVKAVGQETHVTKSHSKPPANWADNDSAEAPLLLLVEDHLIALEAMETYLRANGYRVAVARTGSESVIQAREQKPDLILMDIQMPEMDGLEAIRNIRQLTETLHTPIIALTALAMPGDEARCMAAGANAYLSKPVSLQRLNEIIQMQLNECVVPSA